jgi:RNA polymerase sigma-70 factor (ECF subfamily)
MSLSAPNAHPEPSSSLLQAVRNGSSEGWDRLVRVYAPVVARWCRRAGLQEAAGDDVLQEVFLTVSRSVGDFDRDQGSGSFCAWLATITRTRICDHLRRQGRQPAVIGGSDFLERLEQEPAAEAGSSMADEFRSPLVRRALDVVREEVKEATWQAFWRTVIDSQAPEDVGRDLGMTSGAVRSARFRVLHRLQELLE